MENAIVVGSIQEEYQYIREQRCPSCGGSFEAPFMQSYKNHQYDLLVTRCASCKKEKEFCFKLHLYHDDAGDMVMSKILPPEIMREIILPKVLALIDEAKAAYKEGQIEKAIEMFKMARKKYDGIPQIKERGSKLPSALKEKVDFMFLIEFHMLFCYLAINKKLEALKLCNDLLPIFKKEHKDLFAIVSSILLELYYEDERWNEIVSFFDEHDNILKKHLSEDDYLKLHKMIVISRQKIKLGDDLAF